MKERLEKLAGKARQSRQATHRFFKQLKKKPPRGLDDLMQELHDREFSRTDCLECANCCKTTGPLFTRADIERISRHFRLKPGQFISKYLLLDEDQDYVLRNLPCTFLAPDNRCSIYAIRPKACREFPHTDRKKFHQIGSLTLKNVAICPAAYAIVEAMKVRLKS
jgi:Fe-S-cluster containining protein